MLNKYLQKPGSVNLKCVLCGAFGVLLFFLLIFLLSLLSETHTILMNPKTPAAKACLFICALICGLIGGRAGERGRFFHALSCEAALFVLTIVIALASGPSASILSLAIDFVILLFGAFAGALSVGGKPRKRRGKR